MLVRCLFEVGERRSGRLKSCSQWPPQPSIFGSFGFSGPWCIDQLRTPYIVHHIQGMTRTFQLSPNPRSYVHMQSSQLQILVQRDSYDTSLTGNRKAEEIRCVS
jgi:hypothetical protein